MPARHAGRPGGTSRLRWIAGVVGAAIAGAAIFAVSPAGAAGTTVDAQLSLSGVATKDSVLGGSLIGVHPGDTVDFKASALPTAGLNNIPALGSLVTSLLNPLLGQFQVVVHLGSNFPGGARSVTLGGPATGPCKGAPDLPITFPSTGTYNFTWDVQYVLPLVLGCTRNGVASADLNLLKGAGVALNASNQWVGQVVVATHPPTGGLGLQLPGISVAPSLPVLGQLPAVGLPGANVQLPVTLPTLPTIPGVHGGGSGTHTSTPPPGADTSSVECVPCAVMTQVGNGGSGPAAPDAGNVAQIGHGLSDGASLNPAGGGATPTQGTKPGGSATHKQVNLAANKAPAAQIPLLLAIIAIIALSLVTATYAKLVLLRRN
ncbi:MAG: hypothetical protein M3N95_13040 [Actinomycetota bacterium]|nr:hypothetical protein [Actinomycetota bacterium]